MSGKGLALQGPKADLNIMMIDKNDDKQCFTQLTTSMLRYTWNNT